MFTNMKKIKYEKPEIIEIGELSEWVLGVTCASSGGNPSSSCDSSGGSPTAYCEPSGGDPN